MKAKEADKGGGQAEYHQKCGEGQDQDIGNDRVWQYIAKKINIGWDYGYKYQRRGDGGLPYRAEEAVFDLGFVFVVGLDQEGYAEDGSEGENKARVEHGHRVYKQKEDKGQADGSF